MQVGNVTHGKVRVEFPSGAEITFFKNGRRVEEVSRGQFTESLRQQEVISARKAAREKFKEAARAASN